MRWATTTLLALASALLVSPMSASAQGPQPTPPAEVHEHIVVDGAMLTPTRETSGTAWIPGATPMYGVHRPWRGWDVRVNGAVFVQALYEPRDCHPYGRLQHAPGRQPQRGHAHGTSQPRRRSLRCADHAQRRAVDGTRLRVPEFPGDRGSV